MTDNCSKSHSIEIINMQTNEHVRNSIVLLKGKIVNCVSSDLSISITHALKTSESFYCCDLQKTNNRKTFKCLIQLDSGRNDLIINYCCASKPFTIFYDKPTKAQYILKVYYIICKDHSGEFQSDNDDGNSAEIACNRINLAMQLIQCLIAEKLFEAGFGRKTFKFLDCKPFFSALSIDLARTWDPSQLWSFHAKEFLANEKDTADCSIKYVGLLASSIYTQGKLQGHASLGAGDVAIYGTACIYTWPTHLKEVKESFQNDKIIDTTKLMDDSNSRGTYGGCFATTLGSLCHEIGHIFDLGHTNNGIMGNGFDFINRVFCHENITTILPARHVSNCQSINSTHAKKTVTDSRLTHIKKSNRFLNEYQHQKDNDLTFFCKNCNILLSNHKWLNQFNYIPFQITISRSIHTKLTSILPIYLVELRDKSNGLCIEYYEFSKDENKHEFIIPDKLNAINYDILVLDSNGNIKRFSE